MTKVPSGVVVRALLASLDSLLAVAGVVVVVVESQQRRRMVVVVVDGRAVVERNRWDNIEEKRHGEKEGGDIYTTTAPWLNKKIPYI